MEGSSMRDLDEFQSEDIVTDLVEYMAALVAAKEGICVKNFVIKLDLVPNGLLL
jgi:hypothetical protein